MKTKPTMTITKETFQNFCKTLDGHTKYKSHIYYGMRVGQAFDTYMKLRKVKSEANVAWRNIIVQKDGEEAMSMIREIVTE